MKRILIGLLFLPFLPLVALGYISYEVGDAIFYALREKRREDEKRL